MAGVLFRQPARYAYDSLKNTNMKKLFFLPLLFFSLSAFACGGYENLYPKWSIGVIGIGNYSLVQTGFKPYFLPGVQFTHTRGQWAERVAVEQVKFFIPENDVPAGSADMGTRSGNERRTLLRAGVERGWFLHRLFRPYAAVDLAGQLYKSDMTYAGGFSGLVYQEEIKTKGIGVMPTVGFKTFIGRRISVFAEYRAEVFYNSTETNTTYKNGTIDTRPVKNAGFDVQGGTIAQVGVQVMF